jgi:hypothetical protein
MENKTSGRYFWFWIVAAVLVASIAGNLFFQRKQSQPVEATVQESSQVPRDEMPTSYEVIKVDRHFEIGNIDEATYRVTIPTDIKQSQAEPTLRKIANDIIDSEPELDQFTVFMYSDKAVVEYAYDIGRAVWAQGGEYGNITPELAKSNNRSGFLTTIDIEPNIEQYLASRNQQETINGLSTEQRKAIYKDLVDFENKGFDIAEDTNLTPKQWLDQLTQELNLDKDKVLTTFTEHYYPVEKLDERFLPDSEVLAFNTFSMLASSVVLTKHNLDYDTFSAIKAEGLEKNWY